ncbi:MAG: glucose-6-phosphate isomerase family protein [Anaerolineaceae bacterium]|nr:glucose-6-phosphate isomerase family protein [Anaerolineaceae bacterium]
MADLTEYAGFSLEFDPSTLAVTSGDGLVFTRSTRLGRDLADVVCYPQQLHADRPAYMMDILQDVPEQGRAALERYALTYSLVLLPPAQIGREFIKTTGHYHPPIPGTHLGYPEVYTQLYGKLLLALQRRSGNDPEQVMDYVIVEMTPGFVITIPPNYAQCLINPTGEPALMAGLYGKDFKPDYAMTRNRRGLAYYVLAGQQPDELEFLPNPCYPERPEIQWLQDLEGTSFAPDYPHQPVWAAFMRDPASFAFLTQAQAAAGKFPHWE